MHALCIERIATSKYRCMQSCIDDNMSMPLVVMAWMSKFGFAHFTYGVFLFSFARFRRSWRHSTSWQFHSKPWFCSSVLHLGCSTEHVWSSLSYCATGNLTCRVCSRYGCVKLLVSYLSFWYGNTVACMLCAVAIAASFELRFFGFGMYGGWASVATGRQNALE